MNRPDMCFVLCLVIYNADASWSLYFFFCISNARWFVVYSFGNVITL